MAQIRIENVRKDFGSFTAVQSSSFTIEDGEFFMLLGPSGCGKTTTLRMMAGLELPTKGEIYIDGEEVGMKPASQRDIAFVFQMFALYPHMNVRKNISYPLKSQGMPSTAIKQKVGEIAEILGITDILDRPVGGLSGGDRQRVALGRAIVRDPKAFFMDEPLGALDAEFREHMSEELRALHDRMNATTVYVTHDQLEAMQMGDKIVVMNHGVVEQFGVPQDIYDWPATKFVAQFIGSPRMNVVPVATVSGAKLPDGATSVGMRPEHIDLVDAGAGLIDGTVDVLEYLGADTFVILSCGDAGQVTVRVNGNTPLTPGDTVGLSVAGEMLHAFDGDGLAIR